MKPFFLYLADTAPHDLLQAWPRDIAKYRGKYSAGYQAIRSARYKKLVDLGLADPKALGLHGHSWSGYTTSYIVTQTNIFAAAVAGAPVSNMTSAYGGIRWGTGLARQFQYEQSQSRLSGSLWAARQEYVENSPLFYADRVEWEGDPTQQG